MSISPVNVQYLINLIKQKTGIHLTEEKLYLLESRLLPLAKQYHYENIDALIHHLHHTLDKKLLVDIAESMTTNESSFFRDIKPFEQFRDYVIPFLQTHVPKKKHFRIWSAACSTGQEPYSIAMTLLECQKYKDLTFEIIATDLAGNVLEKAKRGHYSQFDVQRGVPITLLIKYFTQEGDSWVIKEPVRNMVHFQQHNLLEDFSYLGVFDVIFCRNVLIYFDQATKSKVLEKLGGQLQPYGVLFLGAAESIFAQSTHYCPFNGSAGIHILKK